MVKSRSSLLLPIDNTRRTLSPEYWRCSPLSPVPLGGVTLEGEGEWISLSPLSLSFSPASSLSLLLLLPCLCFSIYLAFPSAHTHTHHTRTPCKHIHILPHPTCMQCPHPQQGESGLGISAVEMSGYRYGCPAEDRVSRHRNSICFASWQKREKNGEKENDSYSFRY